MHRSVQIMGHAQKVVSHAVFALDRILGPHGIILQFTVPNAVAHVSNRRMAFVKVPARVPVSFMCMWWHVVMIWPHSKLGLLNVSSCYRHHPPDSKVRWTMAWFSRACEFESRCWRFLPETMVYQSPCWPSVHDLSYLLSKESPWRLVVPNFFLACPKRYFTRFVTAQWSVASYGNI